MNGLKGYVIVTTFLLLLVVLLPLATAETGPFGSNVAIKYASDEVIVRFKPGLASEPAAMSIVSTTVHQKVNPGITVKKDYSPVGLKGMQIVHLPAGQSVEDAVVQYNNDPAVLYAEPNYARQITTIPNDPEFQKLWGLHNTGETGGIADADIDTPDAWNITTGTDDGSVIIALIDTGIDYRHPDLQENIWINTDEIAGNGVDDDKNGYVDDTRGWDFGSDDNNPMDTNGHGTHCAGTIGATGNNNLGITGVNWRTKIMALNGFRSDGYIYDSDAIEAIQYANNNGATIISCSWGGAPFNQALKDAIDSSGALFVIAAGNNGRNNDNVKIYPASYTSANILAVAATDNNDSLATFSNYGATSVDVAAPGVDILSTTPGRRTLFFDPMTTLSGWTVQSPWGLSATAFTSSPSSSTDSPAGNYSNNADSSIRMKNAISLTGAVKTKLEYRMRVQCADNGDKIITEGSTDGSTWDDLSIYTGENGDTFYSITKDLSTYDGEPVFYLRFRFVSDGSGTSDGVYIDDVRISDTPANPPEFPYDYKSGTSMATPHVSGVAGLIKSVDPGLTSSAVKARIMDTVDTKPSLTGKMVTGGRVNAARSLPPVPITLKKYISRDNITWRDDYVYAMPNEMMYFKLNATNTGTHTLTMIQFSDDGVPRGIPYFSLSPGASVIHYFNYSAGSASHIDTGRVTAKAGVRVLSAQDTAQYRIVHPNISFRKSISHDNLTWNDTMLETAGGLILYYNLSVKNTGDVPLSWIQIYEGEMGLPVGPLFVSVPAGSARSVYIKQAAGTTDYENLAYAVGEYHGIRVTDNDTAGYHVVRPEISLKKHISANNASWNDNSVSVPPGATVYYRINVTNNGTGTLKTLSVTDDGSLIALLSLLSEGQSRQYYFKKTAGSVDHTNKAQVSGSGGGVSVQANDTAMYHIVLPTPVLGFVPQKLTLNCSQSGTMDVVLDSAPAGLGEYTITLGLVNSTKAEILSLTFPDWAGQRANSTLPADTLLFRGEDSKNSIRTGAKNVVLGRILLRGDCEGISGIRISNISLIDDSSKPVDTTVSEGLVAIKVPVKALPGYLTQPTDPDKDGIYEDLNGNGRLDFADVVLYFNQMEWIAANEPICAFDLNGNRRTDFADIVKLFGEI